MVSIPAWWHLGPSFSWGAQPGTQPQNVGIMEHKSKLRKGLLQNHEGGQWEKKGKAGRAAEA